MADFECLLCGDKKVVLKERDVGFFETIDDAIEGKEAKAFYRLWVCTNCEEYFITEKVEDKGDEGEPEREAGTKGKEETCDRKDVALTKPNVHFFETIQDAADGKSPKTFYRLWECEGCGRFYITKKR